VDCCGAVRGAAPLVTVGAALLFCCGCGPFSSVWGVGAGPFLFLLWGDCSSVQTVTSNFEPLTFLKLFCVRVYPQIFCVRFG
jgi:hypothetical protein